jgi:DNA-binding response OmpR family regulator
MTTILIIEDERDLAAGLRANFEIDGYTAIVAHTGEEGLELVRSGKPDVILLDLMLPKMSGYDVLAEIRREGNSVPVLILSARAEEVDKVRGFRTGADDYVTKPFGVLELALRVQALLRRAGGNSGPRERIGEAEVDLERHVILKGGEEHAVSPRAFELLLALMQHRDRVVTRQDLLDEVWGYSKDVTTRTVDAHIAELRRIIEDDASEPKHILTVWKVGYRLRA